MYGGYAAVEFGGVDGPLPLLPYGEEVSHVSNRPLLVLPRARPSRGRGLGRGPRTTRWVRVVLVVPDGAPDPDCRRLPVLRCPDSAYELDAGIEGRLLTAQVSRA